MDYGFVKVAEYRNGLLRSVCEKKPKWLCDFMQE